MSGSFRACWLAAQEADKYAAEIHSDPSDLSPIELGSKRSESIPVDFTPQRVKRQKTQAAATAVSNLHPIPDSCTAHYNRPPTIDMETEDVPTGASILKVQEPWLKLLLDGKKTWEIRGTTCEKPPGTTGARQSMFCSPPASDYPNLSLASVAVVLLHSVPPRVRSGSQRPTIPSRRCRVPSLHRPS